MDPVIFCDEAQVYFLRSGLAWEPGGEDAVPRAARARDGLGQGRCNQNREALRASEDVP